MLLVGLLAVAAPLGSIIPLPSYRSFWLIRAFAMLCALVSIFIHPANRTPWWVGLNGLVRLNLLINLVGLATCTFAVLRYVVLHIPDSH